MAGFLSPEAQNGWNWFSQNGKWEFREVEPEPVEIPAARVTIAEHLYQELREKENRIRRSTFRSYQSQIRVFARWLKQTDLQGLDIGGFTREHGKQFINALGLHKTTLNSYIDNLKHFFALFVERGLVDKNPFEIKKFPSEKTPHQYYKLPQQRLLLDYLAEHDRETWLLVQTIYYCFVRPKEIGGLKVGDFDLETGKLRVRGEISKNKKTQFVAVPSEFAQTLRTFGLEHHEPSFFLFGKGGQPGPKPCSKNHFGNGHRLALEAVGLKGKGRYTLYGWKHTGAVSFYLATKDIKAFNCRCATTV